MGSAEKDEIYSDRKGRGHIAAGGLLGLAGEILCRHCGGGRGKVGGSISGELALSLGGDVAVKKEDGGDEGMICIMGTYVLTNRWFPLLLDSPPWAGHLRNRLARCTQMFINSFHLEAKYVT